MSHDYSVPVKATELIRGHVIDSVGYVGSLTVLANSRDAENVDQRAIRVRDGSGYITTITVGSAEYLNVRNMGYPICFHEGGRREGRCSGCAKRAEAWAKVAK